MTGFAPSYDTFTGGTIAMASLYIAGNVSEKFLGGKVNAIVKVAALNKSDEPITPEKLIEKEEDK